MSRTTEAPVEAPPAKPRQGRLVKVALIASLALNLLLIGAAAATLARFKSAGAMPPGVSVNLIGFAATLPSARRQEIWRATSQERSHMRPLRHDLRETRMQVREAFLSEPFDRERFAQAQARLLEAEGRARAEAQKLFYAIASRMTHEERAAFVQWETRERRGRSRGWWRSIEASSDDDSDAPGKPSAAPAGRR
jgi:uncharacterized membrane protein